MAVKELSHTFCFYDSSIYCNLKDSAFNNNKNNNMFKQDDHFSYKNCYQNGSCININE